MPDPGPHLFDYDQAAEAIDFIFAPMTIARFCDDGTLRRGLDFVIRYIPGGGSLRWRHRLITRTGLAALRLRAATGTRRRYERARDRDISALTKETLRYVEDPRRFSR